MWLIKNRHGIQWEDGMVLYCMAESLITKAVVGTTSTDDDIIVYTSRDMRNENGCGICSWMKRDELSMWKISRCNYEDIESK